MVGGTAGIALIQFPINVGEAAIWMPRADCRRPELQPVFWGAFLSGIASSWVSDALKNYGLVPGAQAAVTSSVTNHHADESNTLSNQGYNTDTVYRGPYSGGAIAVSAAQRGNNFLAFNTSDHNISRTCTVRHHVPDIYAMNAVTRIMRSEGVPKQLIEASALPVHGDHSGNYDELGHTSSRKSVTPNGGEINWKARHDGEQPIVTAQIRSPDLSANIKAAPNGNNWKYTYDVV
jgi:hypothetical protein